MDGQTAAAGGDRGEGYLGDRGTGEGRGDGSYRADGYAGSAARQIFLPSSRSLSGRQWIYDSGPGGWVGGGGAVRAEGNERGR